MSLSQSHAQYEDRASSSSQNLAHLLGQEVGATFDKIDLAVLSVKDEAERQIATGGVDPRSMKHFVQHQLSRQPDLDAIRITNASGQLADGTGEASMIPTVADRDYFVRLRDQPNAGLDISKPIIGRVSGKWLIVFSRRVNNPDGSFSGIAAAAISLDRLQKKFSTLKLGAHGVVSLRDAALGTVVRYPEPKALGSVVGNPMHSKELPEKLKVDPLRGTYFAVGLDQLRRLLAYQKVGNYPFYIIVGLYPDDYLAAWWQELRYTVFVVGIFFLATTLFAWLFARAWRRNETDARHIMQLSHRLIAIQESERRNLALELHDVVSPNLAALKMHLATLAKQVPGNISPTVDSLQADMNSVLSETTVSLRQICANLRPALLDYSGLVAAVRGYADQFSDIIDVSFKVSGDRSGERLPPDRESLLFRIAQEAITNSVKHARAKSVTIELTLDADRTRLTVSDDGIGFDLAGLARDGAIQGLGLLTMRERAEFVGGNFAIHSSPGNGTVVELII
ncbi:hypothetical protein BH11PSE11_BH11PSE11_20780 [soil metagenome]